MMHALAPLRHRPILERPAVLANPITMRAPQENIIYLGYVLGGRIAESTSRCSTIRVDGGQREGLQQIQKVLNITLGSRGGRDTVTYYSRSCGQLCVGVPEQAKDITLRQSSEEGAEFLYEPQPSGHTISPVVGSVVLFTMMPCKLVYVNNVNRLMAFSGVDANMLYPAWQHCSVPDTFGWRKAPGHTKQESCLLVEAAAVVNKTPFGIIPFQVVSPEGFLNAHHIRVRTAKPVLQLGPH